MLRMPILYVFILFLACLPAQAQTELPADSSGTIYTIVEQPPEFAGGQVAFAKYLRENLRTPKENQRACCMGKVYIRFVIETNGEISQVEIKKGMTGMCEAWNKEAINLVKNMPPWKPATHQGKRVKCYYHLPINICYGE